MVFGFFTAAYLVLKISYRAVAQADGKHYDILIVAIGSGVVLLSPGS